MRKLLRRLLGAVVRRSPVQPFVNGRAPTRKLTWGGYYGESGSDSGGAFVALELRLPHRLALGIKVPGARPMRLIIGLIQAANLGVGPRTSPLEGHVPGWERRRTHDVFEGIDGW